MKISIATNWDDALLDKLSNLPVDELYGSFPAAPVGCSFSSIVSGLSLEKSIEHIQLVQKKGWNFNYIMDAICLGNRENSPAFRKEVHAYITWLADNGIAHITVANPFLLEMIQEHFPGMTITLSYAGEVNGINKVTFFTELGIDELIVDTVMNRDFNFLAALKRVNSVNVRIVANMMCLYQCPYAVFHANGNSHRLQAAVTSGNPAVDYSMLRCSLEMISDPGNMLRSRWIRPEDITMYEDAGYDRFTLVPSTTTTEGIVLAVDAYARKRATDNVLEILGRPSIRSDGSFYAKLSDIIGQLSIDAAQMDGFLSFFRHGGCKSDCSGCSHCADYAHKALSFDAGSISSAKERILKYLAALMMEDGVS